MFPHVLSFFESPWKLFTCFVGSFVVCSSVYARVISHSPSHQRLNANDLIGTLRWS